MRKFLFWAYSVFLCLCFCGGPRAGDLPILQDKPYRVGISPSHITTSVNPLFKSVRGWEEVCSEIDLYKYYGVQLAAISKQFTRLEQGPFADFMGDRNIEVGCEFGSFRLRAGDSGQDTVETAVNQLKPIFDAGLKVTSIHLDGPVRRLMQLSPGDNSSKGLEFKEACRQIARFWTGLRAVYPEIKIGLITNFPNWDYTVDYPGYNGHYTDKSGLTYLEVINELYKVLGDIEGRIDFIEVDFPYNYYMEKKTRKGDASLNSGAKLLAVQNWCASRDIKFHMIINAEPRREGARLFNDLTLKYVRHLRRDGIFPDLFLIQSWYQAPEQNLPETGELTFMRTARDAIRLIRELYPEQPEK